MLKHNSVFALSALLAGAVFMAACTDEVPAIDKAEQYTRDFIEKFGGIDTDNDWTGAARIEAKVGATTAQSVAFVQVLTSDPALPGARLAAEYPAARGSFKFDLPKAATQVYVRLLSADRRVMYAGTVAVKATKEVVIDKTSLGIAEADYSTCNVTIGGNIPEANVVSLRLANQFPRTSNMPADSVKMNEKILRQWRDLLGEERFAEVYPTDADFNYTGDGTEPMVKATEIFKTYTLDGKHEASSTSPGNLTYFGFFEPIINEDPNRNGGEYGAFANNRGNILRYYDELQPERGVSYHLADGGQLIMEFAYGDTANDNKLGYIYYNDSETEGKTTEEITELLMRKPRFILIDKGSPRYNTFPYGYNYDYTSFQAYEPYNGGTQAYQWFKTWQDDNWEIGCGSWLRQVYIKSTLHAPVYFGEPEAQADGTLGFSLGKQGSYDFPAGTNIAFFIVKELKGDDSPWRRTYSLPILNRFMGYKSLYQEANFEASPVPTPECGDYRRVAEDFVTYKWGDRVVMGVEDQVEGGDHDANDMLFFVGGDFEDRRIYDFEDPDPVPLQSWIVAVEDLGNTDDFDFNDVVFRVSHAAGMDKAYVEVLAAGGTLMANIHLKGRYEAVGNHIGAGSGFLHVNEFFGETDVTTMINTTSLTHAYGEGTRNYVEIDVDPETFSLSESIAEFFVKINPKGNNSWVDGTYEIHPKGEDSPEFAAPQIICMPDSWTMGGQTYYWCWPKERMPIDKAYPLFANWVRGDKRANPAEGEAEDYSDWYKYPSMQLVVDRNDKERAAHKDK